MRLFGKKQSADPTDIVYEKWHTGFSFFQEHRFEAESCGDYSSSIGRGRLCLRLDRKNLFAWTDDGLYRYDNFLLSADLGIDNDNGYSSAGFLFRRTDDISYYYFLVSSRGYFRLDSVLNGTPQVIIDWTRCPEFSNQRFSVSILADGSNISLYLNGQWIGSASDEGLSAGGISFAGQNYDEKDNAGFVLQRIEVESRPAELEKAAARLYSKEVTVEARLELAESRLKSGYYPAALIDLKRVIGGGNADERALTMAADCCVNLEMYDEAVDFLGQIAEEKQDDLYFLRLAGVYYLQNNNLKVRDILAARKELLLENHAAANLLGNAEFALGNWAAAAEAYQNAVRLEPEQSLYVLNAARALEKAGCIEEAASAYGRAATDYFRRGDYDELDGILPFLEKLDEKNAETRSLRAKLLFANEDFDEAGKIFDALINENLADSTAYYLTALIAARNGDHEKAVGSFKQAVEMEPDYYLYHFKKAEYHFLNDGDYKEGLKTALNLAPSDPWVLNLAGLSSLREGDFPSAVEAFREALSGEPESDEIKVNLSEALFLDGKISESLDMLNYENPVLLNQRGNILSRQNNPSAAMSSYEAAYKLDHDNPDIILNLAAACIESDLFSRGEELLIRSLEIAETAEAFNLMGNLAQLKGEYNRAAAAFEKALEVKPGFEDAVCNLASLYISRERLNDADRLLESFSGDESGERLITLKETVFKKRMDVYSCSSCSREWIIPKRISEQPGLKLVGEPPDDMPAGKCPECGKVYCIGCAKDEISEGRMSCKDCGASLKLSEDWMRYLFHENGF